MAQPAGHSACPEGGGCSPRQGVGQDGPQGAGQDGYPRRLLHRGGEQVATIQEMVAPTRGRAPL